MSDPAGDNRIDPVVSLEDTAPVSRVERRPLLGSADNPDRDVDYLTILENAAVDGIFTVSLRYVPDKLLLTPTAFEAYLKSLKFGTWDTVQALALAILGDINNEIVPRWVQVEIAKSEPTGPSHRVLVEDRQPKWDNPALLARLPPTQ